MKTFCEASNHISEHAHPAVVANVAEKSSVIAQHAETRLDSSQLTRCMREMQKRKNTQI